ncbi:hypothetical protein PF011_g4853 [Phytophthora fragariae]|uniref:Uncharacterized protein n=4 Tax=Phytophthora TaxID=4783 RepID=A0A6A3LTP9_9STRA|nr:hypothetical protein PF011_g4853 [Phytophthora fragariae]
MGDHQEASSAELTRSFLSFRMLKEVLQSTNIKDDEEAVMVTRMCVDPRHVEEFERLLRMILKTTHTVGHVSTCVVRPPPGEFTYTSIVKYSGLQAMRQIYPSTVESGVDFYKLLAARDSLLLEPPTYQIEAGFGTWIESDGNTKPMRGDDPEEDANLVYQSVPGPCCNDSCENPHGLNVRASFVAPTKNFQLFRPRYQRNNKKGGQKNLRCFPCCHNGRHVSSGFCGDSIRVHVAVSRMTESGGVKICPIQTTRPAVLAFARFLNLEGTFDQTVSGPEVFPGQTIEKTDVLAWVRDKEHPMNPLFPGILRGAAMETSSQSAIFEFNAECKAWHYGWTAPRGQGLSGSDAQHVLEVLFMKPMGSYMYCLERLRSDGFSIFSSRRASHAVSIKPEAEAFDNQETADDRNLKRKRTVRAEAASPSVGSLMPPIPSSPASTVVSSCATDSPIVSPSKEYGRCPSSTRVTAPPTSTGFVDISSPMTDVPPFKMENIFGSVSSPMAVCPPSSSVLVDTLPSTDSDCQAGSASNNRHHDLGTVHGTTKTGVGIALMGVIRPDLAMRNIIPVVMAGVPGNPQKVIIYRESLCITTFCRLSKTLFPSPNSKSEGGSRREGTFKLHAGTATATTNLERNTVMVDTSRSLRHDAETFRVAEELIMLSSRATAASPLGESGDSPSNISGLCEHTTKKKRAPKAKVKAKSKRSLRIPAGPLAQTKKRSSREAAHKSSDRDGVKQNPARVAPDQSADIINSRCDVSHSELLKEHRVRFRRVRRRWNIEQRTKNQEYLARFHVQDIPLVQHLEALTHWR